MIRYFFSGILFFACLGAHAQFDISLSIESGASKMKVLDPTNELFGLINLQTYPNRTLGVGAQFTYRFNRLSLETGLSYNLISATQTETYQITNAETGEMFLNEGTTGRKAHYLNIPLFINYSFGDFTFGAGPSIGYLITDSRKTIVYQNNTASLLFADGNQLAKFDYGLNAQIGYAITDKWTVQTKAYLGLRDISNGSETGIIHSVYGIDPKIRELKSRQITIGFKYYIRPKIVDLENVIE